MRIRGFALIGLLALAGCGDNSSGDTADRLEEAANQSDPAAAAVLENAAEAADQQDDSSSLSEPGSLAQNALQQAGQAQTADGNGAAAGRTNPDQAATNQQQR
jgi:hypothetical protein